LIQFELQKYSPFIRDFVILLDISYSMKNARIYHANQTIMKIYDNYIAEHDRVAYIVFNTAQTTLFSLNFKKKYDKCMRGILEQIPMYN